MANEYIRKEWAGGTTRTTLNGNINASATSITLADGSSFPSGVKPFVLVIDRGTATEEKIICTSRTGNTLTVLQRGYDGSSAQSHTSGAYIEHILDAYTVDQANAMSAAMTTQGDIIYKTVTGDNTSFGRLGIGTTGYPLVSAGTAPAYQQLGQTGIASTAVTAAKINSDVAGLGLVKNGGTGALDVNVDNASIEIATDTVRVKSGGILQTHIGVNQIVDSQIASNANIAYSKLNLGSSIQRTDFATGVRPLLIVADAAARNALTGIPMGQLLYQNSDARIYSYTGAVWRVEVDSGSYTPTVDNLTLGTGGTNSAVYSFSRAVLTVSGLITLGTGGAVSGNVLISYPSGFQCDPVYETDSPIGTVIFNAGASQYSGIMSYNSGSRMKPLVSRYNPTLTGSAEYITIAGTSASVPGTWVSGSDLRWSATIHGVMAP